MRLVLHEGIVRETPQRFASNVAGSLVVTGEHEYGKQPPDRLGVVAANPGNLASDRARIFPAALHQKNG